MQMPRQTDVVVVGLGPGGEFAANKLARAGLRVVAVEKHLVGGECPFYGCNPSKIMVRAADALAEARRLPEVGGEATVVPSWEPVARHVREAPAANDWDDTPSVDRLEQSGATVVRGQARLLGPREVEVDGETVHAARGVLLSTGTDPAVPPLEGLDATPYWTNRDVVAVTELPGSLVVVGAGPIGCELAQVFARFGVRVTLVEAADRLLSGEEPEVGDLLATVFTQEGVRVMPKAELQRVSYAEGAFTLDLPEEQLTADKLLLAAGRSPNLPDLGLDAVGVDGRASAVPVDAQMRVLGGDGAVVDGLYAVGDIVGHGAFTHTAKHQAAVAVRHLLDGEGLEADLHAVPRVTFTDPEVGAVGLTEQQARDQGREVRVGLADLAESSRGKLHGPGATGLIKLVAEGEVLVGATSVGPAGGEVLSMLTLAVHARVPLAQLRSMIHAYPTWHGAVRSALADLG